MLPDFTAEGALPGGIHSCDVNEFEPKFIWSRRRRQLWDQMQEPLGILYDEGYRMVVFGGEFVSRAEHPAEYLALYDCDPLEIENLDVRFSHFDRNARRFSHKLWGGLFFPASFRADGTGATWLHYLSMDGSGGQRGLVALSLV